MAWGSQQVLRGEVIGDENVDQFPRHRRSDRLALAGAAGDSSEAANGLRVHIDMQEPSGEWADPKGWAHHMWGGSGFKAWAAMEHYRLTGDRAYLEAVYPHMAASSRWQESKRRETRASSEPSARGLMPRGMGDGGLMNGSDFFGIFYTHNILATFADRLSAEAAVELGKQAEATELRKIYESALQDLRASLQAGCIQEEGYRWIPDSPDNRGGSRWGMLYALFPAGLMEPGDPLITGSLKKIEHSISAGGQPVHTGWMEDGAWVGITLDNVAETHLALGNGDAAMRYLYSSLNHGTPLYTWCEERGLATGNEEDEWRPPAPVDARGRGAPSAGRAGDGTRGPTARGTRHRSKLAPTGEDRGHS